MEEIREGADFAGHLLEELASLFERAVRGFVERLGGLAELREAEVDGENGLGHARHVARGRCGGALRLGASGVRWRAGGWRARRF